MVDFLRARSRRPHSKLSSDHGAPHGGCWGPKSSPGPFQARPELNGELGEVIEWDKLEERWKVCWAGVQGRGAGQGSMGSMEMGQLNFIHC